jgi:hypothetical protein
LRDTSPSAAAVYSQFRKDLEFTSKEGDTEQLQKTFLQNTFLGTMFSPAPVPETPLMLVLRDMNLPDAYIELARKMEDSTFIDIFKIINMHLQTTPGLTNIVNDFFTSVMNAEKQDKHSICQAIFVMLQKILVLTEQNKDGTCGPRVVNVLVLFLNDLDPEAGNYKQIKKKCDQM